MTLNGATILIGLSLVYVLRLLVLSRRRDSLQIGAPSSVYFVFLVPCLNEERVIGACLDRLADLTNDNFSVLVIDDGSDDHTATIVQGSTFERVQLMQRTAPNARKGKGEALNAAYRYLLHAPMLEGRNPQDVIVAVVDADGRLASNALYEVAPYFRDPRVGGVQIGVRMYNASESLLARMQDVEFVTFTEIFQRARQHLGSAGLGGNGQFTRLSALQSLGDAPWTDRLTEDLDLGIQLLLAGWTTRFCPTSDVSQQAVVQVRRLVRQRVRWFQGHLQCWARIPDLVRSDLPPLTVIDLSFHLLAASLVLLLTIPSALFFATLIVMLIAAPSATSHLFLAHDGFLLVLAYLLSFAMAPIYGVVYWLRDGRVSLFKALLLSHAFAVYSYIWVPAGWRALGRTIKRRRDWAKTARSIDKPTERLAV